MPNTQVLKGRIKSVKNTKKITKAMELVSASKMRRAQQAALRSRAYRNSAREILNKLQLLETDVTSPLLETRTVKTRLYILITSDRGLAGAYNSNVLKHFMKQLRRDAEDSVSSKVIVVGRKGAQFTARLENIELLGVYTSWPDYPNSQDIAPIMQEARAKFVDGSVDEVIGIFTDYQSSINQVAVDQLLLPAQLGSEIDEQQQKQLADTVNNSLFEPTAQAVFTEVVPKLVEAQVYQIFQEAAASEQSMRMIAMKNASDNAGDLIDDLNLEYNSVRQSAITQEIAEITGGAAAIS